MNLHGVEPRDHLRAAQLGMSTFDYLLWRGDLRRAYQEIGQVGRWRMPTTRAWMQPGLDQTDEAA